MSQRNRLFLGVLGATALGYVAWQGHAASARVEVMTDRIDALATAVRERPLQPPPPRAVLVSAPAAERLPREAPVVAADEAMEPPPHPDAARIEVAHRETEDIIRSGVLRPEDVSRLARDLDGLPRAEAFVIRARIADAINQQQLVPTVTPFDLP